MSMDERLKNFLYFSPLLIFFAVVLFWPLFNVFYTSSKEFGLVNALAMFKPDKYAWKSLIFTIRVAFVSTLLSAFFGYSIALILVMRKSYENVIIQVLRVPLFVPYIVIGFIWRALLAPKGYVTMILNILLTKLGFEPINFMGKGISINIAHIWLYIPMIFIISYAALVKINPEIIEAARSLGASGWVIIKKIYLPLTWRALITGTSIVFLAAFVGVSIPLILGSEPTYFPVYIYYILNQEFDIAKASAISMVFVAISMFLGYIYFTLSIRLRRGGYQ